MFRIVLAIITIAIGSIAAYAQIVNPSAPSPPGGNPPQLQFNTSGVFGGISGVTSDNANIGFATSSQLILYGQTAGNCLTVNSNFAVISQSCSAGSQTSIAAGTNITTSGTAGNVTVNVVATPSFTTVIASGNLTAATAQFSGLLTGTNAVFQTVTVSNLTPTGPNCLQETGGVLQATNAACATPTSVSIAQGNNIVTSGTATNITVTATPTGASNTVQFNNAGVFGGDSGFQYAGGSSGIATLTLGNVTTTNARALSIIGTLSSSIVVFDAPLFANITTNAFAVGSKLVDIQATTISVFGVSPSGSINSGALQSAATQCLQASTGGLIFGTAVPCATQVSTPSIAAGTNITTSGTAANTTVNVVATPSFTTVIATGNLTAGSAQFAGFLTAGGASLSGLTIQTATFSSNLTGTTANFSSNLTANIAQFAGFMSAGGGSLSGLTIQTGTFSGNLTGTSANFSTNLTANIAQFAGFLSAGGASLSGLTIQTGTFSGNLTGTTANFTSFTGAAAFSATPTVGAANISFISPSVAQFGLSNTIGNGGWVNWGGESRLAADKGLSISNAGLTSTGLSVNVLAGRTYSIDADLYVTLAVAATSGIAVVISGTYGSTDTHYFGYVVDGGSNTSAAGTSNPIRGATLATAKNTIVGNVSLSGTTGYVSVKGTVSVSAPGTLLIAAATVNTQTAANGVSLTRGSRMLVQDMP